MPWSLRMVLYASIIVCLILLYFGFRYFRSVKTVNLSCTLFFRVLFIVSALLFLAYPAAGLIEYWTTGSFTRTGYPNAIIYLFWYGVVFTGVMVNWLLLHDILRPVAGRFSSKSKKSLNITFARGFLMATALTALYTAVKMVWDTNRITIEEIHYTLPGSDDSFEPLTIVHIADLHADSYTRDRHMNRYVEKVNRFEPDIVVFAGDLITSGTDHIDAGAAALGKIETTYGHFAVLGDHDYWTDTEWVIRSLKQNGISVLQNENTRVDHNGALISITGITELYSTQVQADTLASLLAATRDADLKILASHQATDRLIEASRESRIHQLLGGHTHGGQIRVPVFFYQATAARTETRYVNGNWMLGDMLLNINNGLGFTLSPVRYNAPAQVSVIRITGK
jgi:uncharacterized protein